jgi:hypothetical protein
MNPNQSPNLELLKEEITSLSVTKLKSFLQNIGSCYSFKNKEEYQTRVQRYKNVVEFSWRKDQKRVIDSFLSFDKKIYVVHAVFGSGKTTLLMGMLIHGLIHSLFQPKDVLFISFNISIRNEIKRKLKEFGISSKVGVRTFDSVIYEICKNTEYPYIDLPNFEGKRKHALKLCFDLTEFQLPTQPKIIFIDEAQDLEKSTLDVLRYFFPESRFVFAGDIFQSIQKEPRESVLWYFMKDCQDEDVFKIYMNETPRVPKAILSSLKTALKTYYPEFTPQIDSWKSGNKVSNADIEWRRLYSYSHIFDEIDTFCEMYTPEQGMILTFSSAITVKGAMGDVARVRRHLSVNDMKVNTNHKRNDPESYFLSTANSSKGLERDYVICFLTFPLEKAFVSLSDDIVVNLITVALTRAKKKVIMYVPAFEDKYSRVLNIFENCPRPNKQRIRKDDKGLNDYSRQDYIDLEHSTTETIRQGIIKYDTRIKIKESAKLYSIEKIFEDNAFIRNVPKMITEEERSFVGIFIENLITSTWTGHWPRIYEAESINNNPMYIHCLGMIKKLLKKYNDFTSQNIFDTQTQFDGILIYAQVHIAMSDKLLMTLSPGTIGALKRYWEGFRGKCLAMKPNEGEISIQHRLKMPWLTGVADTLVSKGIRKGEMEKEFKELTLYEIKASIDYEWKDDALLQVLMYALMTGKRYNRVVLLNPFRNEKFSYYFNSESILTLRNLLTTDILIYNFNCMMAKMYPQVKDNKELQEIGVNDLIFLNVMKDGDTITQVSLVQMLSPIKCDLIYNSYSKLEKEIAENKIEKFRKESKVTEEEMLKEVNYILSSSQNKDKIILSNLEDKKIKSKLSLFENEFKADEDEVLDWLDYSKNEEKGFSLNWNDGLHLLFCRLTYLFFHRKFV